MQLKTIKGMQDTRVKPSDFEGNEKEAWDLFPSKYDKDDRETNPETD